MERKVHPKAWTYENIAAMKAQLKSMGLSLDWAREIATCDPAYYKHQQKMFLDFLARRPGRAQAVEGELGPGRPDRARQRAGDRRPRLALGRAGRAARAHAVVLQDHRLPQDLLDALDRLDRWPEKVRLMQHNWIGRSEGPAGPLRARSQDHAERRRASWRFFTTRPDTLFGAKFMALAPDHPLAPPRPRKIPALADFIAECKRTGTAQEMIETAEKQGFDTGIKAIHPFDPAGSCRSMSRTSS